MRPLAVRGEGTGLGLQLLLRMGTAQRVPSKNYGSIRLVAIFISDFLLIDFS